MDYLIVFVAIGVLVFLFVMGSYFFARLRSKKMAQVAEGLELNFYPSDSQAHLKRQFALFYLFDKGHGAYISNYIEGEIDGGVHIAVFDYQYYVGRRGRRSKLVRHTVAHFSSKDLQTPIFRLHPEGVLDKLEHTLFQKQDIDFSSHPKFSSNYQLTGPEEEEIRTYFNEDRLHLFEEKTGWSMEVFPYRVLLYQSGVRLRPRDVPRFIEECKEIFRAL